MISIFAGLIRKITMGNVIITHLVDGDPQGIRSIFIKNKTCQMFVIPRHLFSKAVENKDINLKQPALYIILENVSSEEGEKPRAYIGHAEDVGKRINQHLANPAKADFFDVVLIFVAKDNAINKADVQYLENKAIVAALEAGRYNLVNENSGTSPHLSPDQRDVIEEFSEYVWLLASFYGCKIFHPVAVSSGKQTAESQVFTLHWDGIEAHAVFGNDEMLMLKGSELRKHTVSSAKPEQRAKVLKGLSCEEKEDRFLLKEDTLFPSPSRAAWVACGTGLNGWDHWKNAEGKTLNEVYRQGK
jgi:hypothetical protein